MADHPDRLALELRAAAHEDIAQIFAALNVSARPLPLDPSFNGSGHRAFTDRFAASAVGRAAEAPSWGVILRWGVKVNAFQTPGTPELFIVNDDDSYNINLASVESAHTVERHLAGVADRIVAHRGTGPGLGLLVRAAREPH